MIKKIVIIGCGNMGFAHLSSFLRLNEHFKIYLVDKNKKQIKKIKKKINNSFSNTKSDLFFSYQIPSKEKIDFAIVATHVYQRFEITKQLLKKNKVSILFLEKFLFYKSQHYNIVEKLIRVRKTRTFVNVWSLIFLKNIRLHKINLKNSFSRIFIRKERLLTNLIHYYLLLEIILKSKIFIDFSKSKIIKKKFSQLNFDEVQGKIIFRDKSKIIGEISSNFSSNNDIWKLKSKNKEFHLEVDGGNILIKSKKNKLLKYKFPFSSYTTAAFFKKIIKKSNNLKTDFPRFDDISRISRRILKEGKKTFNKDLIIR